MKTRYLSVAAGALLALCIVGRSVPPVAATVMSPREAPVVIANLAAQDGTVAAVLVNKSPRPVRDVRLLIRHSWLWKNEFHPGTDNPGRSEVYTVRDQIPPGGSVPIKVELSAPLRDRSDGRFKTSVEVVSFTEIGE